MITLSVILSFLLSLAVFLVVFYLLYYIVSILPFPPPFEVVRTLLFILLAIFGIVTLLDVTGLLGASHLHLIKF